MIFAKHSKTFALLCGLAAVCGCADDEAGPSTTPSEVGPAADVRYAYDLLGRLIQAASSDGSGVQYSYDAVGNITAVRRLSANTVSVLEFSPRTGAPGSTVNIFGSGFDPVASGNAVTFNGVAATVSSATLTTLIATVPGNATTGKISVTDAKGSATSAADFVVGASPAPTIADFAPRVGTLGTVVTLTGANFQLDASDDKVAMAGQVTEVVEDATSPTATQLKISVPSTTASGTISLTTAFGKAVTTTEFFAVPTTVNPATVEFTGRLVADGAALTVTTTAGGKKAVLLFQGAAGQGMHLRAQGGNFASAVTADVYAPDGLRIETLSLTNNSVADFTKRLALSGTYSVILSPAGTDKGAMQLSVVGDLTAPLALDAGTAVSLAVGQNARFSFTAQAGKGYGLAVTPLSLSPGPGTLQVTLRTADGMFLTNCPLPAAGSCDLSPTSFATTGTYLLDFDPPGLNAASFTAILSNDASGTIALDAAPTAVTIARAGQNARFSFGGTAGQLVTVVLTGNALDDGSPTTSNTTSIQVFKPSSPNTGALVSSGIITSAAATTVDVILPETGSYTLLIAPGGLDSGTINAQVKTYATGTLTLDGSTAMSLSAGQNARFSFTAQAGKAYGLAVTPLSLSPGPGTLQVTVRKADGTFLTNCPFNTAGSCDLPPTNFATTGTYLMDFDPPGLNTASFTVVLSNDITGTMVIDDAAATPVTIARAGQNARFSLSGTAGQPVTLVLTGNTLDDGNAITNNTTSILVFKPSSPNANPINPGGIATNTAATALDMTLPETGSYTLFIGPTGADSGSINAQVKSYVTGTLALDSSTAVTLSSGRNARFSFAAQAGKAYGLAITVLSFTPGGGTLQAMVRKSDGTFLGNCPFTVAGSCDLAPTSFATTGTYLLDFDPAGMNAASFTAALSNDATGTLTVGAAAIPVTIARAGQNARYSFSGTAGQVASVIVSGNALDDGNPTTNNSTGVLVFKPSSPNGSPISVGSFLTTATGTTLTATLPDTGSYTIVISPVGLDHGSFNLKVQ